MKNMIEIFCTAYPVPLVALPDNLADFYKIKFHIIKSF